MIVLCHDTALEAYRSKELVTLALARIRAGDLAERADDLEVPPSERIRALAERYDLSLPLHILAPFDAARRSTKAMRCHAWSSNIPGEALLLLDDDVYLSMPAFLFQQLSARSDFENRFMLGSELLGSYALCAGAPGGIIQRPKLATRAGILEFLESHPGTHGSRQALDTAKYLLEGARSPKEAEIAALYSLPRKMGGRGIAELEMDRRIELTPEASVVARRRYLVCDHFLRIEGRDHEYDSDDWHLTRHMHEKDIRRENALGLMGVKLTIMTNGQLHDWDTFDAIAQHLAADNDAAFRGRTELTRTKQQRLWERLLFGTRRGGKTVFDGSRIEASRSRRAGSR